MDDYQPLFEALSDHGNLRKACIDLAVCRSVFLARVAADKDLADQYARAKQLGIDNMMEAIIEAPITDAAMDRLDWDRRRWHASKLFPKKYGDKITHASDPDNPVGPLVLFAVDTKGDGQ